MQQLLTPVHQAYKQYRECQSINDPFVRYRYLENTVSALVKLSSITALMIAKSFSNPVYLKATHEVFSSSSLGGWVNGLKSVACRAKDFPTQQAEHLRSYTAIEPGAASELIGAIQAHFNCILEEFEKKGYKCEHLKKPNLLTLFEKVVFIRNKLAHGALDIPILHKIEDFYAKAIKILLLAPQLGNFEMFGKVGSYAKHFRGEPKLLVREAPDYLFWLESPLLKGGLLEVAPFLHYNCDTADIFFLNDSVTESGRSVEYILYRNGQIVYQPVTLDGSGDPTSKSSSLSFSIYQQHKEYLATVANNWKRLGIKISALPSIEDGTPCVYVFQVPLKVLGNSNRHILYVGKTLELQTRLKSYIRIHKGYDDSRLEIVRMFESYGTDIELWYRKCAARSEIAKIERAIYESYRPEFNLIAPPKQ